MENEKNYEIINKESEIDLKDLFLSIWRGKLWILLTLVLFIFIGSKYLVSQPKVYSAKAVFGFKNSNSRTLTQQMSIFSGLNFKNEKDEILTQIRGGNFLRKIVTDLNLLEKPEFLKIEPSIDEVELISLNYFKNLLKSILGIDISQKKLSTSEKIEKVVNKLRNNNLEISEISTGGYRVIVNSINPSDAALLANTIVNEFLDLRLRVRISKSEKSLEYLSKKLSEAKIRMENARGAAEKFALARNVLSNAEFENQSRRLKEFRITIEKLNSTQEKLEYYNNKLQVDKFNISEYTNVINAILDLSPRIKPTQRFIKPNGERDLKKEFDYYKKNVPKEISRIIESKKVTVEGFKNLGEKAKKTSEDARELQNLEMDINLATTRYEALVKEFETQSFVEGYESAIGEIYETALPPLNPSKPNAKLILTFSALIGLLIGCLIALLISSSSNKLQDKKRLQKIFDFVKLISLSRNFQKLSQIKKNIANQKTSKTFKKDLLMVRAVISDLKDDIIENKPLILAFATTGFNKSIKTLALSLGFLLSKENKRVLILDTSENYKGFTKYFSKDGSITKKNNSKIQISPNLHYLYSDTEDILDLETFKNYNNDADIIVKIVDQIDTKISSLNAIISSNIFFLVNVAKITKVSDLERFKSAIGKNLKNCRAVFFVKNNYFF